MTRPSERLRRSARPPTSATYRRRRLAPVAAIAAIALIAGLLIGRGGGGGPPLTPKQAVRAEHAAQPVHFTVEASGDLLIHSPVWERALALGGGSRYDFAPEFAQIKPYVSGASLALCHVETPMTSAAPTSSPILNTPPALAEDVKDTDWADYGTAFTHSGTT